MNENKLVQQVLSGNTSAFSYFVETYQDMAITIAYRVCGNMQDAEDVVQESYVRAYKNLHSFRSDSKFSTWLYRIVYNTAVSHTKSQMWMINIESEVESAEHLGSNTIEVKMEDMERSEIVADVLRNIPKGDSLLLTLYYMEDNSVKDIAQITGLNESNVKVKLFRARKIFKNQLTRQYRDEKRYV